MKKQKLYPFNAQKHAHDIEFRKNRCYNERLEMVLEVSNFDQKLYDKLDEMECLLSDLLCAIIGTQDCRGIAWLTGKQWALAQESVLWATSMRG